MITIRPADEYYQGETELRLSDFTVRPGKLEPVVQYLKNVSEHLVEQAHGSYIGKGCSASVGAHLANFYEVADGTIEDFGAGFIQLAIELNADIEGLMEALYHEGAAEEPDGAMDWQDSPATVFERMKPY